MKWKDLTQEQVDELALDYWPRWNAGKRQAVARQLGVTIGTLTRQMQWITQYKNRDSAKGGQKPPNNTPRDT